MWHSDNISKFLKNLAQRPFPASRTNPSNNVKRRLIENKYGVNIPMRYYYKSKFRKGWVNIVRSVPWYMGGRYSWFW